MSAPTPPILRSVPRYRPARRGPGGRALGVAALLVGLVAAGRAAWLARARRGFAGLRGPRFEKAVGSPADRLDATVGAGPADDPGAGEGPVIDATVVREAWTSGPQDGQDPITDATVVDDPGETP